MNKKNVLIIFLIIFNIIFIYKHYSYMREIGALKVSYNKLFLNYHEDFSKESILNPVDHKYKIFKVDSDFDKNKGYRLLVFLDSKSCIECVQNEVRFLNDFYKKYPGNIKIYYIGPDENYLKNLNPLFPFELHNNIPKILMNDIPIYWSMPFALFVNPDNIVMNIHKVERGNALKSKYFYHTISLLLNDIVN